INLEDSPGEGADRLLPVSVQAGRLGAARAAALREGIPIFINARIDSYLLAIGNPNGRLAMTMERAHAFVDAGADGIFVPGLLDPERIRELAGSLSVPLNVMAT